MESRAVRWLLRLWVVGVLLFLFVPIAIIVLYAFNGSNIETWPITSYSTKWFAVAWQDDAMRTALVLSIKAGLLATAIALILGSCAAFAVHRFKFFGREAISLLLVLPLALPGIVTGIALQSFFYFTNVKLSLYTIVIGHATFCIVIVYNNALARLRRTQTSLVEASMDLGAGATTTFWRVTRPMLQTAIVAGALLAFALSFDEVIVTLFTAGARFTLPLWILGAVRRGQQFPEVNVVVFGVLVFTVPVIWLAARLTGGSGLGGPLISRPEDEE
jgi:putative spermidine/putrescine transport system permease protein